jgi:hypothetical protein
MSFRVTSFREQSPATPPTRPRGAPPGGAAGTSRPRERPGRNGPPSSPIRCQRLADGDGRPRALCRPAPRNGPTELHKSTHGNRESQRCQTRMPHSVKMGARRQRPGVTAWRVGEAGCGPSAGGTPALDRLVEHEARTPVVTAPRWRRRRLGEYPYLRGLGRGAGGGTRTLDLLITNCQGTERCSTI